MTKKIISKLAAISYSNGSLDEKKVKNVSSKMSRRDLNYYIKTLKNLERKKTITIILSKLTKDTVLEKGLKNVFPGKKIVYKEDKTIIAGIKIVDYDNVYDFSFKNRIDNLANFIK